MTSVFLIASAVATLISAFTHSYFGEKKLIAPLIASNSGVMVHLLAQQVIRYAWHLTSLIWIGQALLLLQAATNPHSFNRALVAGIGILYLGVGMFDAIATRGKHIGWPLLTAIGVFALLSLW